MNNKHIYQEQLNDDIYHKAIYELHKEKDIEQNASLVFLMDIQHPKHYFMNAVVKELLLNRGDIDDVILSEYKHNLWSYHEISIPINDYELKNILKATTGYDTFCDECKQFATQCAEKWVKQLLNENNILPYKRLTSTKQIDYDSLNQLPRKISMRPRIDTDEKVVIWFSRIAQYPWFKDRIETILLLNDCNLCIDDIIAFVFIDELFNRVDANTQLSSLPIFDMIVNTEAYNKLTKNIENDIGCMCVKQSLAAELDNPMPGHRPITHRDIPMQIGISFQTYDTMINDKGEIENSQYTPEYMIEAPMDSAYWQLKDMR